MGVLNLLSYLRICGVLVQLCVCVRECSYAATGTVSPKQTSSRTIKIIWFS